MPELADFTIYIEALEERIFGKPIERIRLTSPVLPKGLREFLVI